MARLARPAAAIAVLLLTAATGGTAAAQSEESDLILSDDSGHGAHIGTTEEVYMDPVPVSAQEIVDEFKRLCLDTNFDAAAHAKVALESDWGFKATPVRLKKLTKGGQFTFTDYRSRLAITSLWRGEGGDALKQRPYRIRMRGLVITGPVRAKDLYSPQCNLTLKTSGLSDAAPLVAALDRATGAPAAKAVVKSGWADGHWKIAGPSGDARRVSFDIVDMKKREQLVHLTVQTLSAANP